MTSSDVPPRRIVISGPPGAGKTALLDTLRPHVPCVDEAARRVLASERARSGHGTGDQDPGKFVDLMRAEALRDFRNPPVTGGVALYDRGLPDLIAYAAHYGLCTASLIEICRNHRYDRTVIWLAHWPEIYRTDEERAMTAEAAAAFGEDIRRAYETLGYELHDLGFCSIAERARRALSLIQR